MKKLLSLFGLLAFLTAPVANAEEVVSAPAAVASAPAPAPGPAVAGLPAGATVRSDEASLAFFTKSKTRIPQDLAVYRDNPSMPHANADFLRDQVTGVATTSFFGYLPTPKLTACAEGCDDSAYPRVIQAFLKGYTSYTAKAKVEFRGEMPIQVRWFHPKRFFVPLDSNSFGISFVFEGKLISLGKTTVSNSKTTIDDLAYEMGERLAYEMLFRAGAGLRPQFLTAMDENGVLGQAGIAAGAVNGAIKSLIGGVDARSRMEPVDPVAHKHLLPAVDGIEPGEVRPIGKMMFIPSV